MRTVFLLLIITFAAVMKIDMPLINEKQTEILLMFFILLDTIEIFTKKSK